jgi:uncharacterized protein (TIGR04255 family)
MKKTSHKQYRNPTIIEAVIEIRFSNPLPIADTERLEQVLGSQYKCKREELVVYSAAFNPSGVSLQQDKPGQIRLNFTIRDQVFAQVYPDRFSFHWVGLYPGWKVFQPEFERFGKQLCKALPGLMGQQVGVRYVNMVEKKTADQKVGLWLKPSTNYPKSVLSAEGNYFYRCKWPLRFDRWVQMCIAEAELTNLQFKPLILDIDIIQKIEKPLKLESSLSKFASDLHDEVVNIFEASISSHYKKLLNANLG